MINERANENYKMYNTSLKCQFPDNEETVFYRNFALNVWFAFICVYCMAFTNTLFGKEGPLEVHKYFHGFLLDVKMF